MKMFKKSYDGGPSSGVTGYWLIEAKNMFSIVLLRFSPGSREAYHNHAFNAVTWWLKGAVVEQHKDGRHILWKPSLKPKLTTKDCFHKIVASPAGAWALSFRGPWDKTWQEHKAGKTITLAQGRKLVE